MHKIDRNALLQIFGYRSTHSDKLPAELREKLQEVPEDFEGLINLVREIHTYAVANSDASFAPKLQIILKRISRDFNSLWQMAWDDFEAEQELLVHITTLRNELADLKCQILEVETAEEMTELRLKILDQKRQKIVSDGIVGLDYEG
jgi:hypothetical protein